ncbi:FecCD family ABC transporter permease [Candidatus Uabimicrobium sp. HlEnr_7]|uniref:FecCD family ABC transporter permease n=1 Tax=Candidatus Uabimicrobium helgolandensis TaxID=3095367 RepID=UPI003557CB43
MKSRKFLFLFLAVFLVLSISFATIVGSVHIPLQKQMFAMTNLLQITNVPLEASDVFILLHIRLPRAILAALVGFSLAFCGTIMQGIFRNPLADPYLLGIASGATAGATMMIVLGFSLSLMMPIGAFLGAIFSVAITYLIAQSQWGSFSNVTLILSGVAMGAMFSSITTFFIFISEDEQLRHIMFWIMGSLANSRWLWIFYLSILLAIVVIIANFLSKQLDALSLGDDMAFHLGVNPAFIKKLLLLLATILTAAVVCVSGTIGFVGIIIPHTSRLLFGSSHKKLLIASGFMGAIFLVFCDILSRTIAAPVEIPIGIITAIFGAPFFLYLLIHHKKTVGSIL